MSGWSRLVFVEPFKPPSCCVYATIRDAGPPLSVASSINHNIAVAGSNCVTIPQPAHIRELTDWLTRAVRSSGVASRDRRVALATSGRLVADPSSWDRRAWKTYFRFRSKARAARRLKPAWDGFTDIVVRFILWYVLGRSQHKKLRHHEMIKLIKRHVLSKFAELFLNDRKICHS